MPGDRIVWSSSWGELFFEAEIEDGEDTDEEDAAEKDAFFLELEMELVAGTHTSPSFSTATWAATWLASFLL